MGMEAHACSLHVFVMLHMNGAVHILHDSRSNISIIQKFLWVAVHVLFVIGSSLMRVHHYTWIIFPHR